MPLPAAAAIGAGALKWLPAIGAVGGALPGLRRGNLGEAALGSGMGALTGYGSIGGLGALTKGGMRMAGSKGVVDATTGLVGRVAPNLVDAPLRGMLTSGARAGIPLLGAGAVLTESVYEKGLYVGVPADKKQNISAFIFFIFLTLVYYFFIYGNSF